MTKEPEDMQFGQDALISADIASGEMEVHDFTAEGVVNLNESRLQLLHTLELFRQINQREGFYAHPEAAKTRYGDNAPAALEGAKRNRDAMAEEAREEFYKSIGVHAVRANKDDFPDFNLAEYEREARRNWSIFQARYRVANPANIRRRNAYMRQLRERVTAAHSYYNQSIDARPYITRKDEEKIAKTTGKEYPVLTSRERLQAMQEDPRAGFLPFTDREKTKVFTWLDYLDNPEYPLGTYNQLLEINIHQQNTRKVSNASLALARQTLRSVIYELHDHWANAIETHTALTRFDEQTAGINPKLPILEILPAEDPALAALIRYRDAAAYRDTGKHPAGIPNPLSAKEDRWARSRDSKNKVVEDLYTGSASMTPEMNAYLAEELSKLTVKTARELLLPAIENEQSRAAFHGDRLREVSEGPESRFLPTELAKWLLTKPETLRRRVA